VAGAEDFQIAMATYHAARKRRRRIEGHDLVGHVPPYPAKLI
jgi:hypothetical protein